jgi:MFS family permease
MSTQSSSENGRPGTPGEQVMPELTHRQVLTVLVGVMLGMLVAALSQTIVATALPTIVGELGGQDQLAWIVTAALLTATASTPIWGKLSDLYGRKIMFQSAIGIFLLSSLAAGFAQNMGQLVGSRAVMGVGVGGLMALSQAIIGDVVSPRERGRYQGTSARSSAWPPSPVPCSVASWSSTSRGGGPSASGSPSASWPWW